MTLLAPDPTIADRPLFGSTKPRLWTRPLRKLTPETSKGFAAIAFAETLGITLFPWQKWLLIHALELRPDGHYRFRTVVVLVARQNGKTTLLKVLALWRMWEDGARLVFGTSTSLDYAREAWQASADLADEYDERNGWPERGRHGRPRDVNWIFEREQAEPVPTSAEPETIPGLILPASHHVNPRTGRTRQVGRLPALVRDVKGGALDTSLVLTNGARYKVGVAGRKGGRSLSVDLCIADELREHYDWDPWNAMSGATQARPDPQIWALSNMGDARSVVLNQFRDQGVAFIETGEGDPATGLFEWSGFPGCELDDPRAMAQANPSLGFTIKQEGLLSASRIMTPEGYRTEHLCQRVETLNAALSASAWNDCGDAAGTMESLRSRVVLCLDAAPDLAHVSLVAAALLADGRVRVETVAAWTNTQEFRRALPVLAEVIKPRAFGWFPQGPAAALRTDLDGLRNVQEIQASAVPGVCQGTADLIDARRIIHGEDPMLTAQVLGATRAPAGDAGWRFARKGVGNVDAVYAMAGAVHLARTAGRSVGKPRIILPG